RCHAATRHSRAVSRPEFETQGIAFMTTPRALLPISRLGAGLAVALLLGACGERSAAAGTAAASPADAPAPAAATATIDPANWPQPAWPFADDPALEQKVDALLASMTVEEKVGQIIQGDI